MDALDIKKILKSQDDKIRLSTIDSESLERMARMINSCENVILSGCGDKFIIPMISKYLMNHFSKKSVEIFNSRILANYPPKSLNKNSLAIFLTARGKTIDVLEAIKQAKKNQAKIIVITQLEKKEKDSIYSALKGYKDYEIFVPLKKEKITIPSTTTSNTFLSALNSIIIYSLKESMDIEPLLISQLVDLPVGFSEIIKSQKFHDFCKESAEKIKKINNPIILAAGDGPRYAACKKACQIQFLEQCKLLGIPIQSEEFINLIFEEYLENDFSQIWILLKPNEKTAHLSAINRFNEMKLMISEKFSEDRIIIIDPFEYVSKKTGKDYDDIIYSQFYILIIEWLSYYCSI